MTQPASAAPPSAGVVPAVTLPVIRAMLDQAGRARYRAGVLGVRAQPTWAGPLSFTHGGADVRVAPCESALAVWEAITGRERRAWLVVLTDRSDEDLGAGIRAHLVGNRLRSPDPWTAVRDEFAATGLDPALTSAPGHREVAVGLLAARPLEGWPPAPAGVLTRDHALAAMASAHLAFADPVIDLTSVLGWTADPLVGERIAGLRELAGDPLTDAVLAWAADRCGAVREPVLHLLRGGAAPDCVPVGLVAGLLAAAVDSADDNRSRLGREGLIRLEPKLGAMAPDTAALVSWAGESSAVIIDLLAAQAWRPRGEALLTRADELLFAARAYSLAGDSDLLRSGLTRRLLSLAVALQRAFADPGSDDPDEARIGADELAGIERAWSRIAAHRLAGQDERQTMAFHAAVRLARWLSASSHWQAAAPGVAEELGGLVARFVRDDAWADSAVNDAAPGVSDPDLGTGLAAVLRVAAARRAAHDVVFARALARYTASGEPGAERAGQPAPGDPVAADPVRCLEDVLPGQVIPLARATPVLLLVLDGMTAGIAAEIIASVLDRAADGWAEALLPGSERRAVALAVLPTLTEVSRASLLSGRLATGGQDAEQRGYQALCERLGLGPGAALFHKKPLDSTLAGHAIASDIASALADVAGQPLVTCVLNTIDDALDRSDPGGTEWTAAAVRHLAPLLDRARYAGRTVILTSDHGHVLERRQGVQRSYQEASSGRSRPASEPAGDGEMLLTGSRVLMHGGRAVLAVDERLRYGPLKAGYHGGASAAEVIVPVAVLVPGGVPENTQLRLAPPQQPAWWIDPVTDPAPAPSSVARRGPRPADRTGQQASRDARLRSAPGAARTLFDVPDVAAEQAAADVAGPASPARAVAATVVGSAQYAAQRKIAGRLSVPDERVGDLLTALLEAPSGRIGPVQAAAALAVPPVALRGAVLHVQRLLNVEGYPVLRVDADGSTVILDEPLLREQFGIRA